MIVNNEYFIKLRSDNLLIKAHLKINVKGSHKSMVMKVKIHKTKDFYAGLLFIFFGASAIVVARNYPIGTAGRMGAGYFPILLGGLLIVFGLILIASAIWINREKIQPWGLRPLILVLGSVAVFALLIESLGLVVATLALIFISSLGSWEFRLKEVFIIYIILTALAVGVFVYGLKLPFKVWPL